MDEVLGNTMINLKAIIDESGTEITYGNLPTILGDHSQMGQVLQNLINNAIKFQDAKIKPIVHIDCKEKEDMWVFSVKDNGIGIDNKHFHLLFKTFKRLHDRRKYEGSGIGLALCKKIIERHGGRIWVESVLGKGCTFLFTIPKL